MKMAKPSARDIDAAGDLMALLSDLSRGYYPDRDADGPTYFDSDDFEHLKRLHQLIESLLERAPGFPGRVIGGMCYVICWDHNCILDPAQDVLDLHPDLRAGLVLLGQQRADFMPRLERAARAAVAHGIEQAAARHLVEMRAARGST